MKYKKGEQVFFSTLLPYTVAGYCQSLYPDYPHIQGKICRLIRISKNGNKYFDYIHEDFLKTNEQIRLGQASDEK